MRRGDPPSIPGPSPKRPSLRTSVWGFYRCRAPDPVFFHKDNVSVLRELRHGASEAAAGTPSAAWGEHLGVSICRRARSAKTPGVRSNSWNAPSCSLHPFSSTIMRSVPHTVLSRWAITRRVDGGDVIAGALRGVTIIRAGAMHPPVRLRHLEARFGCRRVNHLVAPFHFGDLIVVHESSFLGSRPIEVSRRQPHQ